jgi:hypothetical protein
MQNQVFKITLILVILFPALLVAQAKSCRDLGQELCRGEVTLECMNNNLEKIPNNCLQDITEQAAKSHPCAKQMYSGKELSKECQGYFAESEKKVQVMREHCKALNDCTEVFSRIKDQNEAQKEYQRCIEHNATKVSKDCSL